MQRQSSLNLSPENKLSHDTIPNVVYAEGQDYALFYSASVHFLKRRLKEKTERSAIKPQPKSLSCCNLPRKHNSIQEDQIINRQKPKLSMEEVLPYPKSSKDGFFTRLRNSFRKYRRNVDFTETVPIEEDSSNFISNFKFSKCDSIVNYHSSCQLQTCEESSVIQE